jgi:hypothetical protein
MASLTFARDTGLDRYREATERQKSCAGATVFSFICRTCGQDKKIAGRKQFVKGTTKFGYVCAECHALREARKAKEAA